MSHPAIPIVLSLLAAAAAGGAWINSTDARSHALSQSEQVAAESSRRWKESVLLSEVIAKRCEEEGKLVQTLAERQKTFEARLAAAEKRPDPVTGNDADTVCAALALAERRGEENSLSALAVLLRRVDAERYFREMERLAAGPQADRLMNSLFNSSEIAPDRRLTPILKALLANGAVRTEGYRSAQIVTALAGLGPEMQPHLTEQVQKLLDSPREFEVDQRLARAFILSGLPAAHVQALRGLRSQRYYNRGARDATWSQLADVYAPVYRFPAIEFEEKDDNKLSDAQKASIKEAEAWINENRAILIYDPAKRRMSLTAGGVATTPAIAAETKAAPVPASKPVTPKPQVEKSESKPEPKLKPQPETKADAKPEKALDGF